MLRTSYRIARVWGIPIKVHISLIVLLVSIGFLAIFDKGGLRDLAMTLAFAVLIFASVAVHELGHSFIAMRKGCRVREITLMIIGGMAQMERIPTRPRDEMLMAAVGPLVSLVLGTSGFFGGLYLLHVGWLYTGSLAYLVGRANLVLAGFNLVPAFPMDGGRILRALFTRRLGRMKATLVAARLGQVVSVLMGCSGVALIYLGWFSWPVIISSCILMVIAVFIFLAAGREYRSVVQQETDKLYGFGADPRFEDDGEDDASAGDTVIIGPPPHERAPPTRATVRRWWRGGDSDGFA